MPQIFRCRGTEIHVNVCESRTLDNHLSLLKYVVLKFTEGEQSKFKSNNLFYNILNQNYSDCSIKDKKWQNVEEQNYVSTPTNLVIPDLYIKVRILRSESLKFKHTKTKK